MILLCGIRQSRLGKGFDRAVELDALELSKENDTITVADGVKMYKNSCYTL
jgi:hypothetical protein